MSDTTDPVDRPLHRRPPARLFIPALMGGWATIGFGIHAAVHDARDAHPFALVVHIVAFDLVHDLVLAPLLFLGVWLVGAVVPRVARGPVLAAAATSALLIAFAFPLLRRWGQRPTNSSTLPLDYGRNVGIVLGMVWLVAAVTIAHRLRVRHRNG